VLRCAAEASRGLLKPPRDVSCVNNACVSMRPSALRKQGTAPARNYLVDKDQSAKSSKGFRNLLMGTAAPATEPAEVNSVNLRDLEFTVATKAGGPNLGRSYHLRADSVTDLDAWVECIETAKEEAIHNEANKNSRWGSLHLKVDIIPLTPLPTNASTCPPGCSTARVLP
jgi:hypothetical protein